MFTEHVRTLTSFADLSSLANTQADEVFVTRVLEKKKFLVCSSSCVSNKHKFQRAFWARGL